jgi:hypothetical protein
MSLLLLIRVFLARVLLMGIRMRSQVRRRVSLRVWRLEQLLVLLLGILLLPTKVILL